MFLSLFSLFDLTIYIFNYIKHNSSWLAFTFFLSDHKPEASVVCFLVPRIDQVESQLLLSSLSSFEKHIPLVSLEEIDHRVYQAVSNSFRPKRNPNTTFSLDSSDFVNLSKAVEALLKEFDGKLRFDRQKSCRRATKRDNPHEQIIFPFTEGSIWSEKTKQWHVWSDHIFSFMIYFNVFKFCVNETVPGVYTFFPFHALHVTLRNA